MEKGTIKKIAIGLGVVAVIVMIAKMSKGSGDFTRQFLATKSWNGNSAEQILAAYPGLNIDKSGGVTVSSRPDLKGQVMSANLIKWDNGSEWVGA